MLDKQQKKAVEAKEDKVIVVAGAGSGKTRVITERLKYLLNSGVRAANIVCITFTNMAAEEMAERLNGVPRIGDAFIGTIHSFANKVLKASDSEGNFEIFSEEHNVNFHKYLINRYCKHLVFDRWLEYEDLRKAAEIGKVSDDEVKEFLNPSERAELLLISRPQADIPAGDDYPISIDGMCKARNIITFDELLVKATAYFNARNIYPEYVLVDELQDVGSLEYGFIRSLKAKNYFFVGDDWQAIYGFKGGNVSIFKSLVKNNEWKTYWLTNNYRNSKAVLNVADEVISQVSDKLEKDISRCNKSDGDVIVGTKNSLESMLEELHKTEQNFGDWFFLVRTNKQIFEVMDACKKYHIPCIPLKREGMSLQALRGILQSNVVKLLTVHASKGLESKNVLLYGSFPVEQPAYLKNEEERKVMYVGVTRAKENLVILN